MVCSFWSGSVSFLRELRSGRSSEKGISFGIRQSWFWNMALLPVAIWTYKNYSSSLSGHFLLYSSEGFLWKVEIIYVKCMAHHRCSINSTYHYSVGWVFFHNRWIDGCGIFCPNILSFVHQILLASLCLFCYSSLLPFFIQWEKSLKKQLQSRDSSRFIFFRMNQPLSQLAMYMVRLESIFKSWVKICIFAQYLQKVLAYIMSKIFIKTHEKYFLSHFNEKEMRL